MPSGVYKRTKGIRLNISCGHQGITPWNKGNTKYADLLTRIKWLTMGQSMTLSDIYSHYKNEISYKKLQWLLSKARANEMLDPALIKENRGLMKNKGGGCQPKFNIGDKVRILSKNNRTPLWLRSLIRLDNPRTIIDIFKTGEMCTYYLGTNNTKNGDYLTNHRFRANELIPYVSKSIGRPRVKRAYNRKTKTISNLIPEGHNKGALIDVATTPSITCVNCI